MEALQSQRCGHKRLLLFERADLAPRLLHLLNGHTIKAHSTLLFLKFWRLLVTVSLNPSDLVLWRSSALTFITRLCRTHFLEITLILHHLT